MKFEWVARKCPLCGDSRESRVFAESTIDLEKLDEFAFASRKLPEYMHPRLVECAKCGILYTNPGLPAEALAQAYQSAQFDSGNEAHYASAIYARQIRRILARLPDRVGALDIGTGDGAFLEELLSMGFKNVQGSEPSDAPIAAAKSHIKPLIRSGLFRTEAFPKASFSLISCFQTMEHVSNPKEIAESAYALLKPGGVFAVVVHNRKSISARFMGLKSPIFDIEHLQLFCPETAKKLLEQAGFKNIEISVLWNRYPLSYWMRLLPMPLSVKQTALSALQKTGLGRVSVSIPAGNLICFGFR